MSAEIYALFCKVNGVESLQRSRAQVSAEMALVSIGVFMQFMASTEPRSSERGNRAAFARAAVALKLQRSRAQVSAEIRSRKSRSRRSRSRFNGAALK